MPRQYKPGVRNPRYRRTDGRMSNSRIAWMRTVIGQFVIMKDYDTETAPIDEEEVAANSDEYGPTYRLLLPLTRGGRTLTYNITALTHEEFVLLKEFFDLLFKLSEPVILERDRIAQDAWNKGDDSFARIYRQVPQLVVRQGALGENSEGVQDGPEDLLDGDSSGGGDLGEVRGPDGGVRGVGDELAPGEPQATVTQDNESSPDES